MENYFSIIEDFARIKVLVVGDVMLDRYWWGSVNRISPEAPVPVVNLKKTSLVAGGAANVAANIKGLGAEAVLIGVIGCGEEGDLFKNVLKDSEISSEYLLRIENRPTTIKTRIVAHNQHVVRIDQEDSTPIESNRVDEIIENILKIIDDIDVVVISDYAKGVLTVELLNRLIALTKKFNKPLIVDPKGENYKKYRGATIITPNQLEAAQATELEISAENLIEKAGEILLKEFDFDSVLITRGEDGMTLFEKNSETVNFKATARKVFDVTGAGDTVIATLAVAYGASGDLVIASELANSAAGLVVEEVGTTIIKRENLKNYLSEANKVAA